MGSLVVRAFAALSLSFVFAWAARASAQSNDPNCGTGRPDGFEVLPDQSTAQIPAGNPTSFTCNLKGNRAGIAVTVEYACAAETEASWQSKTANRTKNVVSRSATEVLVRENREVKSYAGTFDSSEKLFLRVDARTIATVFVASDAGGNGGLVFGAEDAAAYARARATANAPFTSEWKCPEGDMPPIATSSAPPAGSSPAPSSSAAGKKKSKAQSKEKDSDDAPILGLSWPVVIAIVAGVVLSGAALTWILRRPRRPG